MTKQEFLAMSLPYELRCQYEGITSFDTECADDYFGGVTKYDTNHKYGKKIGILKEIHIFKKYWVARCGIKSRGLKAFVNGSELFPILHPLSDLTKEIEHKGERFGPYKKLGWEFRDGELGELITFGDMHSGTINILEYLSQLQLLLSWHFDIANLISKGEAIDVNTLEINPYK